MSSLCPLRELTNNRCRSRYVVIAGGRPRSLENQGSGERQSRYGYVIGENNIRSRAGGAADDIDENRAAANPDDRHEHAPLTAVKSYRGGVYNQSPAEI